MTSQEIVARVLYRDALVLVLDKPAGLPVHPGPKGGETLRDHLDALRFGLPRRPEVAHRLDRDTSGCLALGRHAQALARLGALFQGNRVEKVYWAVVEGGPEAEAGSIDLPLAPRSPDRGWWMKVDSKGQPALTHWRVLGRSPSPPEGEGQLGEAKQGEGAERAGAGSDGTTREGLQHIAWPSPSPDPAARGHPLSPGERGTRFTWLELRPVTGRTHQLRVHCAAMGWPILGDAIYGTASRFDGPGLHLHARSLALPLYPKKPPLTVEAPAPEHMQARLSGSAPGGL